MDGVVLDEMSSFPITKAAYNAMSAEIIKHFTLKQFTLVAEFPHEAGLTGDALTGDWVAQSMVT